jgi:hypothetical protein
MTFLPQRFDERLTCPKATSRSPDDQPTSPLTMEDNFVLLHMTILTFVSDEFHFAKIIDGKLVRACIETDIRYGSA